MLDEALLLTTELSTNGVLHAGTDIDLEVIVEDGGLTVTVTDFSAGTPAVSAEQLHGGEVQERGRGLFLVDHFASAWGVTHHPTGKGVWFRLVGKPDDTASSVPPVGRFVPQQPAGETAKVPARRPPRPRLGERTPALAGRPAGGHLLPSPSALAGLAAIELYGADAAATGPTSPIGKL